MIECQGDADQTTEKTMFETGMHSPVRDDSCLVEKKIYSVSWGSGIRLAVSAWFLLLIVPLICAIGTLDPDDIPPSMLMLFGGLFGGVLMYLVGVILVAPWSIVRENAQHLSIRISPFSWTLYRLAIDDIRRVYRLTAKDFVRAIFSGIPTNWSKAVGIELKSGKLIPISLEEPEEFICDMSIVV